MFKKSSTWVFLAQLPLAWEWFKAGWDKIMEGGLGADFASGLGKTLGFFAKSKDATGEIITNPHGWYIDSLLKMAQNNSTAFGYMVEFGELLLGIMLFVVVAYYLFAHKALPAVLLWLAVVGLVGGVFLNFNFYFATGWNNVSSASINLLMGLLQVVFIGYYLIVERTLDKQS